MKKALSLFLALVLCLSLSLPALAAAPTDADQENAAWTLYHMGLFQGTDTDKEGFPVFSLSDAPTRAQGVCWARRRPLWRARGPPPSPMSPNGPSPMSAFPMKRA